MKLQLTQHNVTTTIEVKEECQTTYEMAQFFREILLAQGYHPQSVSDAMPDEEDGMDAVDEMVSFAAKQMTAMGAVGGNSLDRM